MKRWEERIMIRTDGPVMQTLTIGRSGREVKEALEVFARLVRERTEHLSKILSQQEWRYCYEVYTRLHAAEPVRPIGSIETLIRDLQDANDLEGLGKTVWRADAADWLGRLVMTLQRLSNLDAVAILLAVRHASMIPDLDMGRENWWEIDHRTRASVRERMRQPG